MLFRNAVIKLYTLDSHGGCLNTDTYTSIHNSLNSIHPSIITADIVAMSRTKQQEASAHQNLVKPLSPRYHLSDALVA
jgi:hypothetical protein